mgnify:CR=1 FL=1
MFSVVFEAVRFTDAHAQALARAVRALNHLEDVRTSTARRRRPSAYVRRVRRSRDCEQWRLYMPRFGGAELPILLACLVEMNEAELRQMIAEGASPESIPNVYKSGVRYQREPRGCEIWRTIRRLYLILRGDCEDIACALAAWLRVIEHEAANAVFRARKMAAGWLLYHILTQRASGRIEDACVALGMGA